MPDYQVEVLAAAIAYSYSDGRVKDIDKEEALDMVTYLNEHGWRLTRTEDEQVNEGPIQRALGIDGG